MASLLAWTAWSSAQLLHLSAPYYTLMWGGAVFRLPTILISIYGDRCVARMAVALPEIHAARQEYLFVAQHPKAIFWEKQAATHKLKDDRIAIFRAHRTSNTRMFAPHAVAAAASLYTLGSPAKELAHMTMASSSSSSATMLELTSPFMLNISADAVSVMDLSGVCAATLTTYNMISYLQRRKGFSNRADRWVHRCSCAVYLSSATFMAATLSSILPATMLPPYLIAVWLGMAATTAVKNVVMSTAPGRALLDLPDYPHTHGSYGDVNTVDTHQHVLMMDRGNEEERRYMWRRHKRLMEYECGVRLQSMLRRIGLANRVDELEYEAELLRLKREIAVERRLTRERMKEDEERSRSGGGGGGGGAE